MFPSHLIRHPDNDKLRFHYGSSFQGYEILNYPNSPHIENYLESALSVLQHTIQQQHLTFAVRLDLHFPDQMPRSPLHDSNAVLTRFFRHLRYELDSAGLKYPHNLYYLWAREQNASDKPHYHLMLLLNKNAIDCVGHKAADAFGSYIRQNLYHRAMRAWLKAMGFEGDDPRFGQLIHVSHHPVTKREWSRVLHEHDFMAMEEAMFMASYLCKAYSKPFGQGIKVFDTSRRRG